MNTKAKQKFDLYNDKSSPMSQMTDEELRDRLDTELRKKEVLTVLTIIMVFASLIWATVAGFLNVAPLLTYGPLAAPFLMIIPGVLMGRAYNQVVLEETRRMRHFFSKIIRGGGAQGALNPFREDNLTMRQNSPVSARSSD